MTISLRKTVWREIYAAQISTEISTQKIFEETFPPQTPWRESSTDLFQKKTLKHIEREIAAKKYVKIKFYPNMSVEKCATKQTLNRNLFQASSKRNRKIVWGNMPTQKSLKRNLYQKNIWRISPTKKSNNFSTKPTKETLKVHSLPKTYPTPIAWTACDLDFLVRKPNLGGAPSRKYQKKTQKHH